MLVFAVGEDVWPENPEPYVPTESNKRPVEGAEAKPGNDEDEEDFADGHNFAVTPARRPGGLEAVGVRTAGKTAAIRTRTTQVGGFIGRCGRNPRERH